MAEPHPLAERRERRGFSVTKLAVEIGASPGTVRRWESGQATPDARRVADLADVLALPTSTVAAWWQAAVTYPTDPPRPRPSRRPQTAPPARPWAWRSASGGGLIVAEFGDAGLPRDRPAGRQAVDG
ncbi:MAG: helix-turn-helix transcriptional regulator [Pseudonocardia sp.]|nr:helix-turn-helix transcriptional regulator [Pseudonocardia sp.]